MVGIHSYEECGGRCVSHNRGVDDYAAETAEIAYRQGRESGKRRGREDVLCALSNFAGGQELMALDEANPDARSGRLFVIEHIRALIAVEMIRP